jgi:cation diffusion facilitator CzcD-associated flavoprotein CzcO
MESVDCVVIGAGTVPFVRPLTTAKICIAGWFGLAAAKTYIQLHMQHEIVIFDSGSTVGGVWAQERLYPGLRSNNMLGTYEYPDFPMDSKTYGVKSGEHIPGTVVHRYLSDYAARFDLPRRIRFDHRVTTAKQINDAGWILAVESKDGQQRELSTRKLIVATGLASSPHMPVLAGAETFGGSIFHSKDFLQHSGTMDSAHSVVVFGSSKSAWDVAYAYATASTQPAVHLVIRESGRGPALMAPAYVTPLKKWLEKLAHIRFLTWFSPCSWGDEVMTYLMRPNHHANFGKGWLYLRAQVSAPHLAWPPDHERVLARYKQRRAHPHEI